MPSACYKDSWCNIAITLTTATAGPVADRRQCVSLRWLVDRDDLACNEMAVEQGPTAWCSFRLQAGSEPDYRSVPLHRTAMQ
jgi:hypothetical protein